MNKGISCDKRLCQLLQLLLLISLKGVTRMYNSCNPNQVLELDSQYGYMVRCLELRFRTCAAVKSVGS